jgi:hypothetical protein
VRVSCGITSELTGDREACARRALKHLGVRVERPVMRHTVSSCTEHSSSPFCDLVRCTKS